MPEELQGRTASLEIERQGRPEPSTSQPELRTVGVEEEFLLASQDGAQCVPLASEVLGGALEHEDPDPGGDGWLSLSRELQEQQVEARTQVRTSLDDLQEDLVRARRHLGRAAEDVGARLVAVGTSPVPTLPTITPSPRYQLMADRFGMTAVEGLLSGLHVHVAVDSQEEAVGVLDRVRTWLPVLLALSANSPFWQGRDTRYASYRSQVWSSWPTSAPPEIFGSAAAYRREVDRMLATGTIVDDKMIYFPARVSPRYPTVEIRVADVCLEVEDTVLIAALSRGLVETAARAWRRGEPPAQVSGAILRLAHWQAARHGVEGELVHPELLEPRPATAVVAGLVDHVAGALRDSGDEGRVEASLARLLRRGTGASRQRRVLERGGGMTDVVLDAARATIG